MTRQKYLLLLFVLGLVLLTALSAAAPALAQAQLAPPAYQDPTGDPTQEEMVPVETSTPDSSGQLVHEVMPGQAMWSIAIAYGTTIREIALLNNLDPENPVVFAGQKLVIRAGATPTETSATQATLEPTITRTPRPTSTRRPTGTARPTRTATVSPTPTEKPVFPQVDAFKSIDRRTVGIGIVVVCSLGLLMVAVSSLRKP